MFVALSTLVTFEISAMAFLAIFHEVLTLTRPSGARLLEASFLFVIHVFIILFVVNCALASI